MRSSLYLKFTWLLKQVFRAIAGGMVLLSLYALIAIGLAIFPANSGYSPAQTGIDIFIWSNGVHTDFVLPIQTSEINWQHYFPFHHFRKVPASVTHVAMGWGDRKFYMETPTWRDIKVTTALSALFLYPPSAMHVEYLVDPLANPDHKRLKLSYEQYQQLAQYILNSFQKDKAGELLWIPNQGYGNRDAFYEAKGAFSFLNTCNQWTSNGLRHISAKVGYWTPFPSGVFYHL